MASDKTELNKGFEAFNQANYELAYNILLPFAESGNPYAQVHLGYLYLKGLHVEINQQEAEYWLSKAENSGNNDIVKLIDIINKELDITTFAELIRGFG
jgi:TPR repeat protein